MIFKTLVKTFILLNSLYFTAIALADTCKDIEEHSTQDQVLIPTYQSGRIIVGNGHAYFYSAPDEKCINRHVFLVPNDLLNAYVEYRGFTSVIYFHPKTGVETTGWMKTLRLKSTGTGIGPQP